MPVLPIRTDRLRLRMMRVADAAALASYRGLDEVARFQDWRMPFTVDDAIAMLSDQETLDDVAVGQWVQIAIELPSGEVVGDIAVGLPDGPYVAFLGYTVSPAHQGKGYAAEAAAAVVDALFEQGEVRRIVATLDPANSASMRVIEPLGFAFEGTARQSELIRGEWLDDMRFGLLREDRAAWNQRPCNPPETVRLVEIAAGEAGRWSRLETHRFQRDFVATVADSFADAIMPEVVDGAPLVPRMRGIEADGEKVGFMMVADVTGAHPHPYLWRLMIDRRHQRRGIGTAALRQLIEIERARGSTTLLTSYVEGPGSPAPLYLGLGFVPTGEIEDGETVAALAL